MQPLVSAADPVREELERVVASPGFARNERLSAFLRFVVEEKLQGRVGGLKEAVIGVEVVGRPPGYDTRSDPVVRMEAAKLRARLDEYYLGLGASDPVRIRIPKGAYVPQWEIKSDVRVRWNRWIAGGVAACLAIAAAAAWVATRTASKPTIAVLPFLNLSADADNGYLSDGLADEITGLLSLTDGLDVTARTSSFALRGTQMDAREIGAKLNATLLVEGSVQKSEDRLKVIVQLIRAADGKHVWSGTYERQMREVFATEQEIAGAIVSAVRLKIAGQGSHHTGRVQAFELYLRGRQAFDIQPRLALQYFEQAAAVDPNFAPAYAGIAEAVYRAYMNVQSYAQAHQRALAAAEKALALDPDLPEAYIALAETKVWDYAFPDAERAFRRAIALNPSDARAHLDLGYVVLAPLGRFDEAIGEVSRARVLDPLSFETGEFVQLTMLMAKRYKDVEKEARADLPRYSARDEAYPWLALALSFQGKHSEAMETIRAAKLRGGASKGADWIMACVSVRAGERGEGLRMLRENSPPVLKSRPVSRRLFQIYSCLGDRQHAVEYAEKAYADHDVLLPTFLSYPTTAWLRSDPAVAALRRRMGLPND
jgi:TolB-like protein/Flp pilus assembly protein TadD